MSRDFYEVLGVSREASDAEIKTAFRKAAHKYHPDKEGGDAEKFKEANEAYQVLSNQQKRAQYDQFGQTFNQGGAGGYSGAGGYPGGGFAGGPFNASFSQEDLGDILGQMFGFGRSSRQRDTARGEDVAIRLELDFQEAIDGLEKDLEVNRLEACKTCQATGDKSGSAKECKTCGGQGRIRQVRQTILGSMAQETICNECQGDGKVPEKPCVDCSGQGRRKVNSTVSVSIPAGIDSGQAVRIKGQGNAGRRGAAAGDLMISISVADSDTFERDGYDLKTVLELEYTQVVLGDKVELTGTHGKLELDVPAGTEAGRIFRLKGEGVPHVNGHQKGDLFVEIKVATPKKITADERDLLEKFLALRGKHIRKKKRSFFGS